MKYLALVFVVMLTACGKESLDAESAPVISPDAMIAVLRFSDQGNNCSDNTIACTISIKKPYCAIILPRQKALLPVSMTETMADPDAVQYLVTLGHEIQHCYDFVNGTASFKSP